MRGEACIFCRCHCQPNCQHHPKCSGLVCPIAWGDANSKPQVAMVAGESGVHWSMDFFQIKNWKQRFHCEEQRKLKCNKRLDMISQAIWYRCHSRLHSVLSPNLYSLHLKKTTPLRSVFEVPGWFPGFNSIDMIPGCIFTKIYYTILFGLGGGCSLTGLVAQPTVWWHQPWVEAVNGTKVFKWLKTWRVASLQL